MTSSLTGSVRPRTPPQPPSSVDTLAMTSPSKIINPESKRSRSWGKGGSRDASVLALVDAGDDVN